MKIPIKELCDGLPEKKYTCPCCEGQGWWAEQVSDNEQEQRQCPECEHGQTLEDEGFNTALDAFPDEVEIDEEGLFEDLRTKELWLANYPESPTDKETIEDAYGTLQVKRIAMEIAQNAKSWLKLKKAGNEHA